MTSTPARHEDAHMHRRERAVQEALEALQGGATLDRAHAREVMDAVMAGEVSAARFSALFSMLHMRGETVAELAGLAESMRAHATAVEVPEDAIDTCGTGGDGSCSVNVSTGAAFVAAGAGARVAKHGNRAVSSACGSADVLEALGARLATNAADARGQLAASGMAFLFAPAFHPAMRHAAAPRRELRLRTAFNLVGPLCNPASVRRQLVGTGERAVAELLAEVLVELGVERAAVVCGHDGLDEVTLGAATTVLHVAGGTVREERIEPEQLGLPRTPASAITGGDAQRNAAMLAAAIRGEAGPVRDYLVANAAAALVVAGRADGLAEGAALAAAAIDDGRAAGALEAFVASSLPAAATEQAAAS